MSDHPWLESAGAYAVGALAADERAAFEAHLAGCAVCQAEVHSLREVAALLAHGAPAAGPGPEVRERILAEARRVRPLARRPAPPLVPWLVAAAALVVALVGQREARMADERANALTRQLADRDSTIAELLSPELHVVTLSSTGREPSARVFWNHRRRMFIVTAFDLPAAPAGKTYQLWAIAKGKAPISMGTFNTDARGRSTVLIPVSAEIQGVESVDLCGVTQEPAGGSPQPTEAPRLVGAWRHTN